MDGDAGARCMDLVRRSMQGQRAEHEGPKADAAERPTQESQGLLFIEHGGTLQREDRRGGTRNVNRNAEANAKTQRLMGERRYSGEVRPKSRRSTKTKRARSFAAAETFCVDRRCRRGRTEGEGCHAEAAAWIDVIGCCD